MTTVNKNSTSVGALAIRIERLENIVNNESSIFVDIASNVSENLTLTFISDNLWEVAETTLKGVNLDVGKAILLWQQLNKAQNGVYNVLSINPVTIQRSETYIDANNISTNVVGEKETPTSQVLINRYIALINKETFAINVDPIDISIFSPRIPDGSVGFNELSTPVKDILLQSQGYKKTFVSTDWVDVGGGSFALTIPQTEHSLQANTISNITVFETSLKLVNVSKIEKTSDGIIADIIITITDTLPFDGEVHLIGTKGSSNGYYELPFVLKKPNTNELYRIDALTPGQLSFDYSADNGLTWSQAILNGGNF